MKGKSTPKKKYIRPVAKAKNLTTKLGSRGYKMGDVDYFNLLAATCAWEEY